MEKTYVIQVLTLDDAILRFKVKEYHIKDGLIHFTDQRTGMQKAFPTHRATIDEVKE